MENSNSNYGLFFTKVIAFLLTAVTLGFGLPWAKCMVMNKWANNVRIDGRRIQFTGTAGQLVGVWIKVFLLSVVTIGLYYFRRLQSHQQVHRREHHLGLNTL